MLMEGIRGRGERNNKIPWGLRQEHYFIYFTPYKRQGDKTDGQRPEGVGGVILAADGLRVKGVGIPQTLITPEKGEPSATPRLGQRPNQGAPSLRVGTPIQGRLGIER